jgi:hypothetical protein
MLKKKRLVIFFFGMKKFSLSLLLKKPNRNKGKRKRRENIRFLLHLMREQLRLNMNKIKEKNSKMNLYN